MTSATLRTAMPDILKESSLKRTRKILTLVGAAFVGWTTDWLLAVWFDFLGHSCYNWPAGCPLTLSGQIPLFLTKYGWFEGFWLLGAIMVIVGFSGLGGSERLRHSALCVGVAIVAFLIAVPQVFTAIVAVFFPPGSNVHSITKVNSTMTVAPP